MDFASYDPSASLVQQSHRSGITSKGKSVQNRKAQNKEAQTTYRKRKQAAETAQKQRTRRLEDVIEELGSAFIAFTDDMLQCRHERCGCESASLKSLWKMIKVIHSLAEEVVSSEASYDMIANSTEAIDKPGLNREVAMSQTTNVPSNEVVNPQQHLPNALRSPNKALSQRKAETLQMTQPTPLLGVQVFGNGWFHSHDEGFNDLPIPAIDTPRIIVSEFSIRLIEGAVAHSYATLLSDPSIGSECRRIFRWSLRYRTRETLLYLMRWMLGPGRKHLSSAATIPANLYAEYLASGRDLCFGNSIDEARFGEHGGAARPDLPSLMNAEQVSMELRSLKCRFLDDDAIEITVAEQQPSRKQDDPLGLFGIFSAYQSYHGASRLTIRLSKALLIRNMSTVAVCLGLGPAYPADDFSRLIEASATSVTENMIF